MKAIGLPRMPGLLALNGSRTIPRAPLLARRASLITPLTGYHLLRANILRGTARSGRLETRFFSTTGPLLQSEKKKRFKQTIAGNVLIKTFYYTSVVLGVSISVVVTLLGVFFIYDATTYKHAVNVDVNVSNLALNPVRGGPKNLPIAHAYLDSNDTEAKKAQSSKPRLVVLGSGWGSVALLKTIDPQVYDITVISPTNYFLFTPMLPSATVGTLEFRSLMEPIRRICAKIDAHFLEGRAERIEFSDKLVEVSSKDPSTGKLESFYVPYDKLVIGVGSVTNSHGVEGLEHCHTLKTVQDARNIRNKIVSNLEQACLPTTTEEKRKQLLSFVVCGGGPTGVELAAEIFDLLNEDLVNNYPNILRNEISVHIIQSRSHILNTYDEKIAEYATERFRKDSIDVLVDSRVDRVYEDRVVFNQICPDGSRIRKELPFGLCVWSTGVGQAPLTQQVVNDLAEFQQNKRAIETDSHLRVIGAPLGDIYAIGDCSTVRTRTADEAISLLRKILLQNRKYSATGHNTVTEEDLQNVNLGLNDLQELAKAIKRRNPQCEEHFKRLEELFHEFDVDKSGTLSLDELNNLLRTIDKGITSLPATAQRANQQGVYLGHKLTRIGYAHDTLRLNDIVDGDVDSAICRPFAYHHLGSLAYISSGAVFDFGQKSYFGGLIAMYLWRGIYFAQNVSLRTRALMAMDWLKRGMFGRDMSDISRNEDS
ncbi:external alternative NADH-ubiquinone oxidoreductase, mitochondrial [Trichomonascus vanleenenianus]|uniref:external alternative NADH-ubiquinone oxidoreductase, mitochondrial n=1 Tax=Trichomonascus vanleenenianus TaxID=2268995 RepID=UPI003ECAD23C